MVRLTYVPSLDEEVANLGDPEPGWHNYNSYIRLLIVFFDVQPLQAADDWWTQHPAVT